MKISRQLAERMKFAQFCIDNNLNPYKLGELCSLIWERERLVGKNGSRKRNELHSKIWNDNFDRVERQIAHIAAELNLVLDFRTVYPACRTRFGKHLLLPLNK